jgi:hypothetical protein
MGGPRRRSLRSADGLMEGVSAASRMQLIPMLYLLSSTTVSLATVAPRPARDLRRVKRRARAPSFMPIMDDMYESQCSSVPGVVVLCQESRKPLFRDLVCNVKSVFSIYKYQQQRRNQ